MTGAGGTEYHSRPGQGLCVYVVDDDEQTRVGMANLLSELGHLVECYDCGQCFLGAVPNPQGVVVLDMRMPRMSGLKIMLQIGAPCAGLEAIFVSGATDVAASVEAMKAGAHDYLVKPFREQSFIDAVDSAMARARETRDLAAEKVRIQQEYDMLSPSERQVAALVADGYLNKQIAAITARAENTVKVHRSRAMEKMGVATVFELARKFAYLDGVVRKKP